jgi:hypothetical protein
MALAGCPAQSRLATEEKELVCELVRNGSATPRKVDFQSSPFYNVGVDTDESSEVWPASFRMPFMTSFMRRR